MKKILYTVGLAFTLSLGAMAQQTLNGVVKDASGKPFPGVKISKAGEFRINSITDESGVFSLELEEGDYIDLNYADVVLKRVKVTGETMNIVLDSHKDGMSDLGFMKRTEENRTQSVSTIYADQLMKGATSTNRVNNALFGLIPGLQLSQNAGWRTNAGMKIRGVSGSPLVLVDGFQRGLTNMTLEEIESVQVLKDGAATALYGARAANGVLLINTKRGVYNSFDIDVNYRHGFNFPINQPEMADAYTYAMAQNEALHYDGLPLQYTAKQLENFKQGTNPNFYPNTDWVKEGMRDFSQNNQFNIMVRGGGQRVRYMALLDYKNEFGLLNEDYTHYSDRYNSQIRNYELDLFNRYEHGEFFSRDSIKQNENELYYTSLGRPVYGGGGIMPDIFVPQDTTGVTSYLSTAINRGLTIQFTFQYTDNNRKKLSQYETEEELLNYLRHQGLVEQFVRFAESKGLKRRNILIQKSYKLLEKNIYGNIIYNMLGLEAYLQYFNKTDATVNKGIEILEKGEAFPKAPVAVEEEDTKDKKNEKKKRTAQAYRIVEDPTLYFDYAEASIS